ncbi:MAG: recombinase family protein [Pseudobutyrivibrio sp.]|nr:recombinase family protein [Pseudobutyrivibrio sp.]
MIGSKKIYHAAMYLRLSREDGDLDSGKKAESNSISSQKALIKQFLKDKDDIILVSERVDDGYTGSNFERPQFQLMMEDIKRGVVDCVIVKDLSRFGREYIDSGNYLERIFPALGVRFIAITDNVDSINDQQNELMISFKNLLNDAYCRDISIKIRSNLEVKRKNGDVVASFVNYGYMKDPDNKYRMIIDEEAAMVVRDIFRMKLNGYNNGAIARSLDARNILSPAAYRQSKGSNYYSPFMKNERPSWAPSVVRDILSNKVYIGTLTQGRYTTPNHKVKTFIIKPENEWVVIEDHHEPIVSKREFALVQRIIGLDTRTSPFEETVYPLSGLIFCGDCRAGMVKQKVPVNGKDYEYYVCNTHTRGEGCSSHRVPKKKLEDTVLSLMQTYVANILDIEHMMKFLDEVPLQEIDVKELEKKKGLKIKELTKCKELRNSLYEDLKEGIVSQDDYNDLYESYNKRTRNAEEQIRSYERQINDILENKSDKFIWIEHFAKYQNISELSRIAAIELIDKIVVYDKKHIEVIFNFDDVFLKLVDKFTELGYVEGMDEDGRLITNYEEAEADEV